MPPTVFMVLKQINSVPVSFPPPTLLCAMQQTAALRMIPVSSQRKHSFLTLGKKEATAFGFPVFAVIN